MLNDLDVVDLGDVRVTSSEVLSSFQVIESALDEVLLAGGVPVTMGGDGSVTLPQLRAVHRHHPNLVVLHIDAHTDAYNIPGFTTSNTFTRAAEEKVVDVARSFHIGVRGSLAVQGAYEQTRALGYRVILGEDVRRRGNSDVLREVRQIAESRPIYICFDMDYFDPSCAPGVATPTWGGPDAATVLDLLHGLVGLNIVCWDVNTVSPAHDVGGMTAYLAGYVMLIGLHLIARARKLG